MSLQVLVLCVSPVKLPGSDFAVSADPVDPARVNVFERWAGPDELDAFRTSGDPDEEPVDFSRIRRFEIEQYRVGPRT